MHVVTMCLERTSFTRTYWRTLATQNRVARCPSGLYRGLRGTAGVFFARVSSRFHPLPADDLSSGLCIQISDQRCGVGATWLCQGCARVWAEVQSCLRLSAQEAGVVVRKAFCSVVPKPSLQFRQPRMGDHANQRVHVLGYANKIKSVVLIRTAAFPRSLA